MLDVVLVTEVVLISWEFADACAKMNQRNRHGNIATQHQQYTFKTVTVSIHHYDMDSLPSWI